MMKKKLIFLLSLVSIVSFCFIACDNDTDQAKNDIAKTQETSLDAEILGAFIFSTMEKNTGTFTITSNYVNGDRTMIINSRLSPEELIKTRSETANEWIYWGEVTGQLSAVRFAKFCTDKYAGKTFETRYEAIPNSTDRKAYHRLGQ